LGFHTAFVSIRLPLQAKGNFLLEARLTRADRCNTARRAGEDVAKRGHGEKRL
jgi:hypothetical protein